MAINLSFDISGNTGATAELFFSAPVMFSQLFDGLPQFYAGSVIQIQEIVTVNTLIVDEKLVSADLRWFNNKRRRGSYQVGQILAGSAFSDEDEGFLDYESQEIRRYSFYTITANPDVPFARQDQVTISSCNAYLETAVFTFPGDSAPTPGFKFHESPKPDFRGDITVARAPLADTEFFPKLAGVGLYLYPGVEGVSISYKAQIVNDIYTAYDPADIPTCLFITSNCDQQFSAFIAEQPGFRFSDAGTCAAANGQPCQSFQWQCPTDPTDVRTYYTLIQE